MIKIPIIKLKRFTLRPFRKGDERSLWKNANNKKIYKNTMTMPYPYTLNEGRKWVAKNLKEAKSKKPKMVNFVIDINGEVGGSIGFYIEEGCKAEIAYWLSEKYWGKGIMTEAVKLVTKFGFDELKLRRIYALVFSFNKSSMRVLEKSGYKFEGILRKNAKKEDKFLDQYLFAKTI